MKKLLLFLAILFPSVLFAQGSQYQSILLGPTGRPAAGAVITVCAFGSTGIPCQSPINLFSDPGLSIPMTNPTKSDSLGNWGFWALPNNYVYTVTGVGITANGPFVISVPCNLNSSCSGTTSTFAGLPVSPVTNALAIVTDGNGNNCLGGGGTVRELCQWTGTVWVLISAPVSANFPITAANGGTGTSTPTAHGVAIAEGAGTPFNFVVPTNNAQCFMSAPSSFATTDSSFQTCPNGGGGGSPSQGSQGTIQGAGSVAGTFQVSNLSEVGGVLTVTDSISATEINNVIFADVQAGADPCAKIAAAIALLGSPPIGTVDARGFTIAQLGNTCAADPFTNLHSIAGTTYGHLLLPPNYQNPIKTNAGWVVPNGWIVDGPGKVQAGASFPTNTAVVTLCDLTTTSHECQWNNAEIDCNNVSGSIGLYSNLMNENAGSDHAKIGNCQSVGIKIELTASHSPINWFLRDPYVIMGTSANASSIGIQFLGTAGAILSRTGVQDWTVSNLSATKLAACVQFNNTVETKITGGHAEQCTDGVQTNAGATLSTAISVDGLTGNNSITNLIHILNVAGTRNQSFQHLILSGGTNIIKDDFNGVTITEPDLTRYEIASNGKPFTTSASTPSYLFLAGINLATTSVSANHTLTASEGIVNVTATATITAPHALAGQTWQVFSKSGTTTLTIDSGTLFGNGATGPITIPNSQGMVVSCDGTNCTALGLGGGAGGSSSGLPNALQSAGTAGSFQGTNSPTSPGIYGVYYNVPATSSVAPSITLPGVPVNPQSGTSYTIGAANYWNDRGTVITATNSAAQTYTMVNPANTGFNFNMPYSLWNRGTSAGALTENASGFTVNGGASLLIPTGYLAHHWSDGVNWLSAVVPTLQAFVDCNGAGNAAQFTAATGKWSCGASSAGVSSFSGDGALLSNSLSTGVVTATLASAAAHKFWMNNTAGSATPGYQSPGKLDLLTTIVYTDQANTYGAFLQDFSAGTWKFPSGAGATASATNTCTLDTTNKNIHCYINNADAIVGGFASAPANNNIVIAAVSSGNVLLSGTTALPNGTTATTQTLGDNTTKIATDAFVIANALTNPMTTLGDTIYENATPAPARLAGPTTPNGVPQTYSSTPSGGLAVTPAWGLPGVTGRAITGTTATDTIVSTDCNPKRIEYVGSVAVAITLPTATTLAVPNCAFKVTNDLSTVNDLTVTTTTWTCNGAATCIVRNGQLATFYVDPNSATNWVMDITETAIVAGSNITLTRTGSSLSIASTGGGTPCITTALSIQFNNAGAFGCLSNFTWASATGVLTGNQLANSNDLHFGKRFTDSSPTGNFFHYQNAAANADLYKLDVNGNTTQAGFGQFGAATCTTVGTAGGACEAEGTAPTNVSGVAARWPDSTTHEYMAATNGASTATPGMMVRSQPSPVNLTGQTALKTTTTLCAASAGACNVSGQYHIHWNFWGSGTACSAVTVGSVQLQLTWTDENAVVHSVVAMPMWDQKTGALGTNFNFNTALATEGASGDYTISTNGSVIQYATTYTACTTGTGTYNLRAAVTRLQ